MATGRPLACGFLASGVVLGDALSSESRRQILQWRTPPKADTAIGKVAL
jgi:hypothetical protein